MKISHTRSDEPVAVGYHGTSEDAAADVLSVGFVASENDYDWLGQGVYFFQDAPRRALAWATERHPKPAVMRSEISLAACMDLLDVEWFSLLNEAHDGYIDRCKRLGMPVPRQSFGAHRLDSAVINYAADLSELDGKIIETVRGAFTEGRPAFPDSALFDLSHVQIAVRDVTAILATQIVSLAADGEVEGA